MKKTFLSTVGLLLVGTLFSQTLEKRYNNLSVTYYKYSQTEDGFAFFDKNTNSVLVLNANSQLIKTFVCPFTDANASLIYTSKVILNSNGKFKFVITHNKSITIYDEDQKVLFNRDSSTIAKFINTLSGPKMVLLSTYGWQEVFSITGEILKIKEISGDKSDITAYPNPTNQNLTVKIDKEGTIDNLMLTILDINGKEIDNYILDPNLKEAIINVERLNKGLYFYQLKGKDLDAKPEKFIVQ